MADTVIEGAPGVLSGQRSARPTGYAWLVVVALSAAYMMSMIDRFLLSITLEPIRAEYGLTDTQLGLLAGPAFGLFYAIFGLPLGRLADKVHRCRLIFAGMVAWSCATAAVAFATSFEGLFVSRALVAVGEAVLMPAGAALIAAYFTREHMGRATSIFLAGSSIGKSVAFIGGGALLAALTVTGGLFVLGRHFQPWQVLFLVAALPGLVLGILFLFIRDPGNGPKAPSGTRIADVVAHMMQRKAAYGLHIGYLTCISLVNTVFATWAPSFYVRRFDIEPSSAAMMTGVATMVVGPLGWWLGGLSTDTLWRRGIMSAPCWIAGGASLLMVPAVLLFTQAPTPMLSVIGYSLALMISIVGVSPGLAGMNAITPPPHRGLAVGFYIFVIAIVSMGMGPLIIGVANDRLFGGQSLGLSILLLTAAICVVSVLLAAFGIRPLGKAVREASE